MEYSNYYNQKLEVMLPTEIILSISNHLSFKSYIQFSQTCKTLQQILISTNATRYLNHRFKFGKESGSLLLFTYYNIIFIPKVLRKIILDYFINSFKNNTSYLIKAWSLVRAIHCLDPGRHFMLLLINDSQIVLDNQTKSITVQHQREFAIDIIDNIIESQKCYSEICKSKTYQTVFKKLIQSGDLRTVENCLRSLGSPIDSITLSDSNYCNRFPLVTTLGDCDNTNNSIEIICKNSLYLKYNANEMRTLTRNLLEKYNIKVNNYYKNTTTTTTHHLDSIIDRHHYHRTTRFSRRRRNTHHE